jgi:hypothetical protein
MLHESCFLRAVFLATLLEFAFMNDLLHLLFVLVPHILHGLTPLFLSIPPRQKDRMCSAKDRGGQVRL